MNEFLEQFLIECREQVVQATDDLLALEKNTLDKERLDSAFRAFHTLKGGAGIVDFHAMAHAVHAAEDLLAEVRADKRSISTAVIEACLTLIDQIVDWLDTIEATGELPEDTLIDADRIVARFSRSAALSQVEENFKLPAHPGHAEWLSHLLESNPANRARATVAVRYQPDADCFFRGEDPLAVVAALPGLIALDLEPVIAFEAIGEMDPFTCNLVVLALLDCPDAEASAALSPIMQWCEVKHLDRASVLATAALSSGTLPEAAKDILAQQIAMLRGSVPDGLAGRIASAARVAEGTFRHLKRNQLAERIAKAAATSLSNLAASPLIDEIAACLVERPVANAAPSRLAHAKSEADAGTRTLRVDAARIDALVDLTGELTVAINAVAYDAKKAEGYDRELAAQLRSRQQELERLVGRLQQSVLSIRVLPLRQVFQRFPRLVREISGDLGKPVDLVIEGADTEADKAIVEMLFEPLLHVLRNAIDHGIENAATRAAAGKPVQATIKISAIRQNDQVAVDIIDDGAGIDLVRVRQIALARGILDAETLQTASDETVMNLIFEPGFTTASTVTSLSGRGVGMDAVRAAIRNMGGSVTLESRARQGTRVRFLLPFSVMMTRVMPVMAGSERFGVPLDAISETIRVRRSEIVPIGASHAVVLRNRTVLVISLHEALSLPAPAGSGDDVTLVVTRSERYEGALLVDSVGEPMTVMLKPLEGLLSNSYALAGSTLVGDGSVLLILDLGELFN